MKQKMINERRDWMEKYKHDNNGTPPQVLSLYYDQFKVTLKQELDDNQKKEKDIDGKSAFRLYPFGKAGKFVIIINILTRNIS